MLLTLEEIGQCLEINAGSSPGLVDGVATDSRQVKAGNIFVCIPGEHVDGHDFAQSAAKNGAAAILAQKPVLDCGIPVLRTGDAVRAMADLAAYCRTRSKAKVACLTGTSGKTTLKEAINSIMSLAGKTACTEKNHNNQIGLPLTILNADGNEDYWIVEAGISHAGDMDYLGSIVKPDIAIILNVGPGHTEGLGDKGVAWHKTRLLRHIEPGGIALVSADYPELQAECVLLGIKPVYFSANKNSSAPFRVMDMDPAKGIFQLLLDSGPCEVKTPFYGVWGAETAIAAAAAARIMGAEPAHIQAGLASASLPGQRFNRIQRKDWQIFDDTYNANPLSMKRMLEAAKLRAGEQPLVCVLGEMGELGNQAQTQHFELGRKLADIKCRAVFWKGNYFEEIQKGYLGAGGNEIPFILAASREEFIHIWRKLSGLRLLPESGVIFFKGSRANHLENYLEDFLKFTDAGENNVL